MSTPRRNHVVEDCLRAIAEGGSKFGPLESGPGGNGSTSGKTMRSEAVHKNRERRDSEVDRADQRRGRRMTVSGPSNEANGRDEGNRRLENAAQSSGGGPDYLDLSGVSADEKRAT